LIAALTCFGAPVYLDAIGVEPREATAITDKACAPIERVAAQSGADIKEEDAVVRAVRSALIARAEVEHGSDTMQREYGAFFDAGVEAVREARSPWGWQPWGDLVELSQTMRTPSLRDEAEALAAFLEADRFLRAQERRPSRSRRALVELENRLIESSSRLSPSDLRTALDGFVQRLRTLPFD
jgi:hypothetical protein